MIRLPNPAPELCARGLAILAGLLALLSLSPAHALAGEQEGPRLRLAIDRPVHEGERLNLHWEGATGDIDELEILLSVDGGRTYRVCVSPSLDPRSGNYEWTVPNLGGSRAFLRVRFHRDGREIEGDATPLSTFIARGCDLPENGVLPRDADSENERAPKPDGGRGSAPPLRGGVNPCDSGEAGPDGRSPVAVHVIRIPVSELAGCDRATDLRIPSLSTLPRFLPPRK